MSKFETLYANLYEDATGITGAPSSTSNASATGVTAQTPVTNTPAVFDQQHPAVQALAGASTPQAVLDALKKNNLILTPVQTSTSTPVHNDTQTTPAA